MGAVIAPPVQALHIRPQSLEELVDHAIRRVLDLFDIGDDLPDCWREGES